MKQGSKAAGLAMAALLSAVSPIHAALMPGLNGSYYYDGVNAIQNNGATVADVLASAASTGGPEATYTFSAGPVAWTGGDVSTPSNFTGLVVPVTSHSQQTSIYDNNGYLQVATAGSYHFHTGSDDGSYIVIDGITVLNNGGSHGPQDGDADVTLTAGQHRIEVLYYNQYYGNVGGALFYFAPPTGTTLTTNSVNSVPEPATMSLVGIGGFGLYLLRRRVAS